MSIKSRARCGAAAFVLAAAIGAPSLAQDSGTAAAPGSAAEDEQITRADEIVVLGSIGYRNRTDTTEPVLTYGEEYFQRFEPLTAGDALKRVPSVTFLSDVIESDGARLRGLDPGYTQILINGERVPGNQADRSFFLDRIPAELIDRVEIVRSSSARRTGDAVAGSINIVLRDAFELDGGYVRGGALRFDDATIRPVGGIVWGGQVGPGRLLFGFDAQGRYNPKEKLSLRYGDSPENDANFASTFDNREDQTDIRSGYDYALTTSYKLRFEDDTRLEFDGFYVKTDRLEDERSFEYDDPTAITLRKPGGNLLTDNAQAQRIDQESFSIGVKFEKDMLGGRSKVKFGYSGFGDRNRDTEEEIDFDRATPRFTGDFTDNKLNDKEKSLQLSHKFDIAPGIGAEAGFYWQDKARRTDILAVRNRFNVTTGVSSYNQFINEPGEFATPYANLTTPPGGRNDIDETRTDFYGLVEGKGASVSWEVGLRFERTKLGVTDFTAAPAGLVTESKFGILLPSASLKFDVTENDRIAISGARTMRRPNFNSLSPALLEEELGENDFVGDPLLRPELSWGADIGYERRLGKRGVVGLNFFYRSISDLIEVNTVLDGAGNPVVGSAGAGTFLLTAQNTGDGRVYGVEFDLSSSLAFIGLPDTGVFANASWLQSDIDDIFGARRFNDQSRYVYNFGFIQDLRQIGAAFGATYRKQGEAFGRVIGEEVTTSYGGDLEVFVEKRFGKVFTLRAVGSNLLNGSKDEIFNKFTTIADQTGRAFDEFELETEEAGPWFQLVGRLAF